MSKLSLRAVCSAILSLAAIATAPTASAAIITGSWDPVLPAPFVNLGWVATVNLKIDDRCVVNTAGNFSLNIFGRSFGCSANPTTAQNFRVDVLRAQVGLYSTLSGAIVDVLQFNENTMGVGINPTAQSLTSFLLSLNDSSAEQSTAAAALDYKFKLAVPGALPVLSYQNRSASGPFTTATGTPFLTGFDVQPNGSEAAVLASTSFTLGQIVAPSAVPEPGSLALVLLALGATGVVAARRSRRVHYSN